MSEPIYPDGDSSAARTIRLIKAQALRDAADTLHNRFKDKPHAVKMGYLQAEYELVVMAEELEK